MGKLVVWNPEFEDAPEITKEIEDGYQIIGVSLTTNQSGQITWMNFLIWPENQPIL